MRRLAIVCAVTLVAPAASAQQSGTVSMNRYEAAERGSEWFASESLDLRGKLRSAFGVVFDGSYRSFVIARNGNVDASVLRNVGTMHAGANLVFLDRFRLALDLPITVFQDQGSGTPEFQGVTFAKPSEQTIGDLRLGADARIFGEYAQTGNAATLAAGVQLFLPTGSQADWTSDGQARVAPRVMFAATYGLFTYAAKLGFMLNRRETYVANAKWGSQMDFSLAAGLRLFEGRLIVGPELFGSAMIVSNPSTTPQFVDPNQKQIPVEGLFGAHYTLSSFRFGAAIGAGISRDLPAPAVRWMASLEIVPPPPIDTDKDGVPDGDDACPVLPGRADARGCPPDKDDDGVYDADDWCPDVRGLKGNNGCPTDADHDAVPDEIDECPERPGPKQNRGCPTDADLDGVLDHEDACPREAGPKENKGCPRADQDGDGVVDADDACPAEKGVSSPKKELNGCPADLDKDGVANDDDACPREPGVTSSDPTKNGCPLAKVASDEIKILRQVQFKLDSAEIVKGPASEDVLEAVAEIMKAHPEIKKLAVEGHTDNQGKKARNKELSASRAAAVVKWLIGKGVAKERLMSKGWGDEKPLASNGDEEGRALNRRVEFHIVEKDAARMPAGDEPKP